MKILLVCLAILLTGCSAQRISCWNKAGHITYMGAFDLESRSDYIVDVADGVRDFYSKENCQLHEQV